MIDVRADVYSVATVGYELVTGHAVNLDPRSARAPWRRELAAPAAAVGLAREPAAQELDEMLLVAMSLEHEKRRRTAASSRL